MKARRLLERLSSHFYCRISNINCRHDPVTTEPRDKRGEMAGQFTRHNTPTLPYRKRRWRYSLHHAKSVENVRCRLITSWGWRRSQGSGCSPVKVVRELGSERRKTVRSLSDAGAGYLRGSVPSTRGPEQTNRRCSSCHASGNGWVAAFGKDKR